MTPDDENYIGYTITDVGRLLRTVFERRVRAVGLTRAQWLVIARVHRRPGLSQSEVADLLEIEKASAGRLIDRMQAKGWLRAPRRRQRPPRQPPAPDARGRAAARRHLADRRSHRRRCAGRPLDRGAAPADGTDDAREVEAAGAGRARSGRSRAMAATRPTTRRRARCERGL